jgi:cytochrome c-type biogenesis protein
MTMFRTQTLQGSNKGERGQLATWILNQQGLMVVVTIMLALIIASSWLVFPYFVKGQHLLSDVGGNVKQEKLINSITIGRFLTRTTFGVGEAQVDMLYATPKFFEVTGQARVVTEFRPDLYHVFIVTETTHIEDLPFRLPEATLTIDGQVYKPHDVEGPLEVYHHRVVTVRFPAYKDDGRPTIAENAKEVRLELFSDWDYGEGSRAANWQFPIKYPAELEQQSVWTPLMVLGLSAGLLSFVLTPCLIQLLAVYLVTLTGFTADHLQNEGPTVIASAKRRIFAVGAAFAVGFTVLFTATGAVMGYAGKSAQIFFAVWSPVLTVIAGILVIVMGLWVGIRSRAPLVCKLVPARLESTFSSERGSYLGAGLTAIGFSLGCLTCFGGAIIATLLVYVGALGSALIGALVMFAFAMGIVIPFMLAALFLSRTLPLLQRIQQYAPYIGLVSMLVIVAFGLVLVTDNFHILSDFIYPYMGLS